MKHTILAFGRALFTRSQAARELDEELAFHVEMETRANVERGMSSRKARRKALMDLGGVEQTRENVHDVRAGVLDTIAADVRYAARRIRRDPRTAAVVIVTIGLAIGLATTVYSVASSVLLQPLPYRDPSRLVMVYRTVGEVDYIPPPVPEFFDLRDQARTFSELAGIERDGYTIVAPGVTRWADAFGVTANLFGVLGVQPITGRTFRPGEDQPGHEKVIVLAEEFWREAFGADLGVIGQRVRLAGRDRQPGDRDTYQVIGIVPANVRLFYRLPLRADIYIPRVTGPDDRAEKARMSPGLMTFARLAPGANVESAAEEVRAILEAASASHPKVSIPKASSRVTLLHEELVGQTRPAFLLLATAAAVLLAIACVNVAGVLLAGAHQRTQELVVRLAIGCSRRRLWQQLLTEHIVLATAGGVLGILIALWTVPALRLIAPESLPRAGEIGVQPGALAFALVVSLVAGLLFGVAPALGMARRGLSGATTIVPRTRRVRAAFAILTMSLALVLLACAGLIANGLWRLSRLELGFEATSIAVYNVELPGRWWDNERSVVVERDLMERIRALPGVEFASASSDIPFGRGALAPNVKLKGDVPAPPSGHTACDVEFLRLLKIPVRAGRLFERQDEGRRDVVVVNQAFARSFGTQPAIGQRILFAEQWREVVGVVGNVTEVGDIKAGVIKQAGFKRLSLPAIYVPSGTSYDGWPFRYVLVRTSLPLDVMTKAVAQQMRAIDLELTIRRAGWLEDHIDGVGADTSFYAMIITTFALVALTLASVGLYGLLARLVAQRSRELAVRAALGAGPGRLSWTVLGEAAALVSCGLAVGLGLVFFATRATTTLLFEVAPNDPTTIAAAVALLALVAAFATFAPARRAIKLDVVTVLKSD